MNKFVDVYIVYAFCIQISFSILVTQRDLVQTKRVKCKMPRVGQCIICSVCICQESNRGCKFCTLKQLPITTVNTAEHTVFVMSLCKRLYHRIAL